MPQRPMPQRLGRYVVRRRIGNGAFATVWLAYDEQLDSPVAVKVLADNWTEDAHIRRRFQEEGRYLRKVESPNVVSVYDAGELDDGRPYLVMSYADQGTLADRLEVEGLTVAQGMEVVRQVGAGLQALHDRDIVHRDVKPANVLFRSVDGPARWHDGARDGRRPGSGPGARHVVAAHDGRRYAVVRRPRAGARRGAGRPGRPVLPGGAGLPAAGRPAGYQHATLAEAGRPGPLTTVSSGDRSFPDEVDAVLRRGLAHDREERYPSVTAFVAALEAAVGPAAQGAAATEAWLPVDPDLTQPGPRPTVPPAGEAQPVSTERRPRRRRGRAVLVGAVVGVVALALGIAGGYAVERSQTPDERTVDDAEGTLTVTVPADWDRADADQGWRPPNADVGRLPRPVGGHGQHLVGGRLDRARGLPRAAARRRDPGAAAPARRVRERRFDRCATPDGDASTTVVMTGCPGGVTVERVVQVTSDTLLWIQVRSPDRATANRVLDSVETHGL